MHKPPFKSDIHRKALRAAAGVALFGGSFACGGEMRSTPLPEPDRTAQQNQQPEADAGSSNTPVDSGFQNNVPEPDAGFAPDAQQLAPDQGMAMDAGASVPDASTSTVGDAGMEFCDQNTLTWEDYVKCCDMYNWDPNRGCLAWGPPAPPELKQDRKEEQ